MSCRIFFTDALASENGLKWMDMDFLHMDRILTRGLRILLINYFHLEN